MAICRPHETLNKLLEALGLPLSGEWLGLRLELDYESLGRITLTKLVTHEELEKLAEIVRDESFNPVVVEKSAMSVRSGEKRELLDLPAVGGYRRLRPLQDDALAGARAVTHPYP